MSDWHCRNQMDVYDVLEDMGSEPDHPLRQPPANQPTTRKISAREAVRRLMTKGERLREAEEGVRGSSADGTK